MNSKKSPRPKRVRGQTPAKGRRESADKPVCQREKRPARVRVQAEAWRVSIYALPKNNSGLLTWKYIIQFRGMPFLRHCETAPVVKPHISATLLVPPSASMTRQANSVLRVSSMPRILVR